MGVPPRVQSKDVEQCLVLSLICQIQFGNLLGFDRSFLPVEIGDFVIAPFRNLQKRVKKAAKFLFALLPSNNDSWVCVCVDVICPHGRMKYP